MTMAKRYIGAATVYLRYDDRDFYYCTISVNGQHCYTCEVRPAPVGFGPGIAYDSPEAYDQIAQTAVAFGADDTEDAGQDAEHARIIRDATDLALREDGSYHVRRPTKARAA
jgi:hypothetical protein